MKLKRMTMRTLVALAVMFGCQSPLSANQEATQIKGSFRQRHLARLQDRIRAANIDKVYIALLNKGTLYRTLGIKNKKLLAWNSAGRRLYASIQSAREDGFFVWQFAPSSAVVGVLDERLKAEGKTGYSDDLLYIMVDGIERKEDQDIAEDNSEQTDGCE